MVRKHIKSRGGVCKRIKNRKTLRKEGNFPHDVDTGEMPGNALREKKDQHLKVGALGQKD